MGEPQLVDSLVSQRAVEDRARAWAHAMIGIETIIAHPDAPRPKPPYCMLNLINATRRRTLGPVYFEDVEIAEGAGEGEGDGEGEAEERVVETRAEEWEWTLSVHLYGDDALDRARRLINSLSIGTVAVDHFRPLYSASASMVRRVPEQVGQRWENRAQFDLVIHGVVLDGYLADVVEQGGYTLVRTVASEPGGIETEHSFERP